MYTVDAEAMTLNNIGAAQVDLGRLDEAERSLEAAIAIDPQYPLPFFNLAVVHSARNDREHAERAAAEAARLGFPGSTMDAVRRTRAASVLARVDRAEQRREKRGTWSLATSATSSIRSSSAEYRDLTRACGFRSSRSSAAGAPWLLHAERGREQRGARAVLVSRRSPTTKQYRAKAAVDPDCHRQPDGDHRETQCFLSYERSFFRPVFSQPRSPRRRQTPRR